MKPFFNIANGLNALLIASLLLSFASAQNASSLCTKLRAPNMSGKDFFIWAIGFSGNHFYIFASDYSGYQLARDQIFINKTSAILIINLANAETKFIKPLSGAQHKSVSSYSGFYGVIGEIDSKHFVMIRQKNGRDKSDTFNLIDLDRSEFEETTLKYSPLLGEAGIWPNCSYFYNSDTAGKFVVLEHFDTLMDGNFVGSKYETSLFLNVPNFANSHSNRVELSIAPLKGNTHFKNHLQSRTGFVHDGILYAVNNHNNQFDQYKIGFDAKGELQNSKWFSQVFDCNGEEFAKIVPPKNKDKTLVISITIVIIVSVVVLVLVMLGINRSKKKSNNVDNKAAKRFVKKVSTTSKLTSTAGRSTLGKSKKAGSSIFPSLATNPVNQTM